MNPWFGSDGRLRAAWRFLLGVVVAILATYAAIGVAVAVARDHERLLEAIYRPATFLFLLAGFALLLVSADQVHEGVLRAMGLGQTPGWGRQAAAGLAIGAGLVCLAVACIAAAGRLNASFRFSGRALEMVLVELFVLATAAMGEEMMFRGYPFQRLLEGLPAAVSVVIMSALFAWAHGANPNVSRLAMVNTFAIAVVLSVAYLRTRALWMPWGIHFAWNTTLGLVFGLPVSGLSDFAVVVKSQARGPHWVTGGAYGIEASAVGTIVIVAGLIPVVLLTRGRANHAGGLR